MLRPIDNYFLQQDEPTKSCLQFLREFILKQDQDITEEWKYGMPFYCYNGKMFCYLWTHKKYLQPYLGIVEGRLVDHPDLIIEKRSRMKILLIDPYIDLPMEKIKAILNEALNLCKQQQR
jgi:hypothetical protein